ncbi:OmpA family protein [Paraburkholderia sp. BR14263]|uniref:OmpA family protein n=1 Tax=unclassified Paraburkholderia TaxID=2615204 RepID=UPI0034CDAABB
MKSINLAQEANLAFSGAVRTRLARHIGLSEEVLENVVSHAGPVLVASLMAASASVQGARTLFATLRSPGTDARIGEHLPQLVATTAGMKDLEASGDELLMRATDRRVATLSDHVATLAGVPPQAAHAVSGMVSSVLFGILKHFILLEQADVSLLPAVLDGQLRSVAGYVNDGVATAIGYENAAGFTGSVSDRLEETVSELAPAAEKSDRAVATISVPKDTAPPAKQQRSPGSKGIWILLALLAVILGGVFAWSRVSPVQDEPVRPAQAMSPSAGSTTARPVGDHVASGTIESAIAHASPASAPGVASVAAVSAPAGVPDAAASAVAGPGTSAGEGDQPAVHSQFAFQSDGSGLLSVNALLRDDAEKAKLMDALANRFGTRRVNADVNVDPRSASADWMAHLDDVMPLMSVAGAALRIDGHQIELAGTAARQDAGWQSRLQGVFGKGYNVGVFDPEGSVSGATDSFLHAMARLLQTEDRCTGAMAARVFNLQVVNFASSSGHVPTSAKENLTETAQLMKACADGGHPIRFTVAAWSDNAGDPQSNLHLSQKRAEAVRAFLVDAGVPAGLLAARGNGRAQPVASNLTPGGRFANRRIVFIPDTP